MSGRDEELKTLKDLVQFRIRNLQKRRLQECWDVALDLFSDELKQEAIKDIKLFRAMKDSTGFQVKMAFDYKITDIKGVIGYIKWKFNITEEDLK